MEDESLEPAAEGSSDMPRILVLADCDSELGDRPIMLDEEIRVRAVGDRDAALRVWDRVASAVVQAQEVERRVGALYAS
jgi:hypothetical protein